MTVNSRARTVLSRIIEVLRSPFEQKNTDEDNFVTLISVAQDNPQIRIQLLSILNQRPFHRKSLINTWIADLKLAGAPRELQTALAAILNEDVADRARSLLQGLDC